MACNNDNNNQIQFWESMKTKYEKRNDKLKRQELLLRERLEQLKELMEKEKIASDDLCDCVPEKLEKPPNLVQSLVEKGKNLILGSCKCNSNNGSNQNLLCACNVPEIPENLCFSKPQANSIQQTEHTEENPCDVCGICEEPSNYSLKTTDLHYMKDLTELVKTEQEIRSKIDDLERKERSYVCAIEHLKPKCKINQQLSTCSLLLEEENRKLKNQLEDLKMELRHCFERVEGPMKRSLDEQKSKCTKLELELEEFQAKMSDKDDNYLKEINEINAKLCNACCTMFDLNSLNSKLKTNLNSLQKRCENLEEELVKQQFKEAENILKFKQVLTRQREGIDGICDLNCGDEKRTSLENMARKLSQTLKEICPCEPEIVKGLTETVGDIKKLTELVGQKRVRRENFDCATSPIDNCFPPPPTPKTPPPTPIRIVPPTPTPTPSHSVKIQVEEVEGCDNETCTSKRSGPSEEVIAVKHLGTLSAVAPPKSTKKRHKLNVNKTCDILDKPAEEIRIVTTISETGSMEITTEGPPGVVVTRIDYLEGGKVEIVTKLVDKDKVESFIDGTLVPNARSEDVGQDNSDDKCFGKCDDYAKENICPNKVDCGENTAEETTKGMYNFPGKVVINNNFILLNNDGFKLEKCIENEPKVEEETYDEPESNFKRYLETINEEAEEILPEQLEEQFSEELTQFEMVSEENLKEIDSGTTDIVDNRELEEVENRINENSKLEEELTIPEMSPAEMQEEPSGNETPENSSEELEKEFDENLELESRTENETVEGSIEIQETDEEYVPSNLVPEEEKVEVNSEEIIENDKNEPSSSSETLLSPQNSGMKSTVCLSETILDQKTSSTSLIYHKLDRNYANMNLIRLFKLKRSNSMYERNSSSLKIESLRLSKSERILTRFDRNYEEKCLKFDYEKFKFTLGDFQKNRELKIMTKTLLEIPQQPQIQCYVLSNQMKRNGKNEAKPQASNSNNNGKDDLEERIDKLLRIDPFVKEEKNGKSRKCVCREEKPKPSVVHDENCTCVDCICAPCNFKSKPIAPQFPPFPQEFTVMNFQNQQKPQIPCDCGAQCECSPCMDANRRKIESSKMAKSANCKCSSNKGHVPFTPDSIPVVPPHKRKNCVGTMDVAVQNSTMMSQEAGVIPETWKAVVGIPTNPDVENKAVCDCKKVCKCKPCGYATKAKKPCDCAPPLTEEQKQQKEEDYKENAGGTEKSCHCKICFETKETATENELDDVEVQIRKMKCTCPQPCSCKQCGKIMDTVVTVAHPKKNDENCVCTNSELTKGKGDVQEVKEELAQVLAKISNTCETVEQCLEPKQLKETDNKKFELTVSKMKLKLNNLQQKCRDKDKIIEAMIKELSLRSQSGVFEELLGDISRPDCGSGVIDFNRTRVCDHLPRPKPTSINGGNKCNFFRSRLEPILELDRYLPSVEGDELAKTGGIKGGPCHCCCPDVSSMEIMDIRRVTIDSILVKWQIPENISGLTGYQIYVNGDLKYRVLSPNRSNAVLDSLNLNCSIEIALFAMTSLGRCEPPALATYKI